MAVDASFRIQLEQFYIHDGAWCEPGGPPAITSACRRAHPKILIENGVSIRCNKVMVSRGAGAGSVTAYNYMDDGYICCNSPHSFLGADRWQEVGLNNSHMVGGHHMLFEGNWGFNMDSDFTHGNTIYSTYFRNWSLATLTATRGRSVGSGQGSTDRSPFSIRQLSANRSLAPASRHSLAQDGAVRSLRRPSPPGSPPG